MTLPSVIRFRDFELRRTSKALLRGDQLRLRLRSPIKGSIILREKGSDIRTFEEVIKHQVYSPVLSQLNRCEYLIDLGANIGLTSLYFGNRYPDCKIFAVEPNPPTYDLLCTNLSELVKAGRCQTIKAAVWGSSITLVGAEPADRDNFDEYVTREAAGTIEGAEAISGMSINQVIAEAGFPRIDLLKVDIEGAEIELFKGELDWLKLVKCLAIEFHEGSRQKIGFDEIMDRYGFKITHTDPHTTVAVSSPVP